ncbi:hypothetical protein L1887_24663 [Cichorium endivia]|nr:hypothetical protein L1887_24663 [Cichorium endivia]
MDFPVPGRLMTVVGPATPKQSPDCPTDSGGDDDSQDQKEENGKKYLLKLKTTTSSTIILLFLWRLTPATSSYIPAALMAPAAPSLSIIPDPYHSLIPTISLCQQLFLSLRYDAIKEKVG